LQGAIRAPIFQKLPGPSGWHSPGPYPIDRELSLVRAVALLTRRPPVP